MLKISGGRVGIAAAGIVVALVGSSACDHQGVISGTAGMAVQIVPSPAGAGRFETAEMDFAAGTQNDSGIEFLPVDPDRAALYDRPLSVGKRVTLDLTSTASTTLGTVALSPGRYKIVFLSVIPPTLTDTNPPNPPPRCIDNFPFLPSGIAAGQVPDSYTFTESDGFYFDVHTGQTQIQISLDVPGLIAGYENAFTCQASCNGGGPCLTAFDADAFRTTLLNSISFR